MSDKNIDKDIEKCNFLKDSWELSLDDDEKQSIENVLSELEIKDKMIEDLKVEKIELKNKLRIYRVTVEQLKLNVETWEKMAEKLAEEIYNVAYYGSCDSNYIAMKVYEWRVPRDNEEKGKEIALEWARKEVEKC